MRMQVYSVSVSGGNFAPLASRSYAVCQQTVSICTGFDKIQVTEED